MKERIIEELYQNNKYEIALMTTFNFDVDFFERSILNTLRDSKIKSVTVFVDSKELNKSMENVEKTCIGQKYIVCPVSMNSSFHPKVILLLGKKKAKLIVSSINLTFNAYNLNNEIFNSFDYDSDSNENKYLINQAISFFERLNDYSFYKDTSAFSRIKELEYYDSKVINDNQDLHFISNIDNGIIEKISEIINEQINEIDIAVPFYDNEFGAINSIKKKYENAKINVYVQNTKSRFNNELYNEDANIFNIKKYITVNNKNNFYHGKVYRFIGENHSYIAYGSANCTISALVKSKEDNGNIECVILERGNKNDFNEFFESFVIDESIDLKTEKLDVITSNSFYNVSFKYGELNGEKVLLHLSYSNKEDNLSIKYNDQTIEYEENNNEIIVTLDASVINTPIIKLIINESYELNCWFINIFYVEDYRNSITSLSIKPFNFDDSIDYEKEIIRFCESIPLSIEENNRDREIVQKIQYNEINEEEVDDSVTDEDIFVPYVEATTEEQIRYKSIINYRSAKSKLLSRYLSRFFNITNSANLKIKEDNNSIVEPLEVGQNHISNKERFVRTIRRFYNNIVNEKTIDNSTTEEKIEYYAAFYEAFSKAWDEFGTYNICKICNEIIWKIVFENKQNVVKNIEIDFLDNVKMIIIQNAIDMYILKKENGSTVGSIQLVLQEFDKKYKIKDEVVNIIESTTSGNPRYSIDCLGEYIDYIDNLFGYKTEKELISYFKRKYRNETKVYVNENELIVRITTDSIKNFGIINDYDAKELINNYQHENKFETVKMFIISNNTDSNIEKIEYIINCKYKEYKSIIIYKNGLKREEDYKKFTNPILL